MISGPTHWIAVLFSGGLQVRAAGGNQALDNLLEAFDISDLEAEIAKRTSGDFPLSVFRYFPLRFSAEEKQKFATKTFKVRAEVSADGYFERLDPDDHLDDAIADAVSSQLRYWLFIPRIIAGQPQPSTFVLPIQF